MISTRFTAALCIALTLGQAASPWLARAGEPGAADNPFDHIPGPSTHDARPSRQATPSRKTAPAPQSSDPQECTSAPSESSEISPFEKLLLDYAKAYYSQDPRQVFISAQIRKLVFAHPGSQEYVQLLHGIDAEAPHAPEAMNEIAKSLQLHWEAAYGMGFDRQRWETETGSRGEVRRARVQHVRTGEKIGAIVGLIILSIVMAKSGRVVPTYMQIFRQLIPAAAVGAGFAVSAGANAAGFMERGIPVAPAHVMRLGIDANDSVMDDGELIRTLVPVLLGIGTMNTILAAEGTTLAAELLKLIRVVRVANAAATPVKLNPWVLIGSLIASLVVERGATWGIDQGQLAWLKHKMGKARDRVDVSIATGDDVSLYKNADGLVASAMNLSVYINRPVSMAQREYFDELGKAEHKYGVGSAQYEKKVQALTETLLKSLDAALKDMDRRADADYEGYLALGFLLNQKQSTTNDGLSEGIRNRAETYRAALADYRGGFDSWLSRLEQKRMISFGPTARDQAYDDYFGSYIREMTQAKDRQIAAEFRAGEIPRHAGHVLLEAAAFLRSTGKTLVQDQANFLMSQIARTELLMHVIDPAQQGAIP